MYIALLKYSETEARYDISLRKGSAFDNPVLVRVKVSDGQPVIRLDNLQDNMTIAQASIYAQALLIAIQIVDNLNNGRKVEAFVEYDATRTK